MSEKIQLTYTTIKTTFKERIMSFCWLCTEFAKWIR